MCLAKVCKNSSKASKCSFGLRKIELFVSFIVVQNGTATCADTIKAIQEWPKPTSVKNLRSFLGLCGFYNKFVENFAKIAALLIDLLHKYVEFNWIAEVH